MHHSIPELEIAAEKIRGTPFRFIGGTRLLLTHSLLFFLIFLSILPSFALIFLVLFAWIVVHECAHLWAAARCGFWYHDTIILHPMGAGVYVAPNEGMTHKEIGWGSFWIALAGPCANLFCALIGLLLISIGIPYSNLIMDLVVRLNLMLALFNLIPVFPLDGHRAVEAIIWTASDPGDQYRHLVRWSYVMQGIIFGLVIFSCFLYGADLFLLVLSFFALVLAKGYREWMKKLHYKSELKL